MSEPVDNLYAWVTEADGKLSLIGTVVGGFHTPLMSVREPLARSMEPIALKHHEATGQPVRLVRFQAAEVLTECPAKRH